MFLSILCVSHNICLSTEIEWLPLSLYLVIQTYTLLKVKVWPKNQSYELQTAVVANSVNNSVPW